MNRTEILYKHTDGRGTSSYCNRISSINPKFRVKGSKNPSSLTMPVTIKVAKHDAEPFLPNWRDPPQPGFRTIAAPVQDPDRSFLRDLLQDLAPKNPKAPENSKSNSTIIQSTLTEEVASKILPSGNGLVHTCLEAYNRHRHLVLRPDDIWIAIVTQFSFYVNKHSEELRSFFVAHEGKKELVVRQIHFDFTIFTTNMAKMIQVCAL